MHALFVICFVTLFQLQETSVHHAISFILWTRGINYRKPANNLTYLETFNSGLPLKVLIHGSDESPESDWIQKTKSYYQSTGEANVILVDWTKIAKREPLKLPRYFIDVAETVTDMIKKWHSYSLHALHDVHIVAYSEGAHIAAIVGYTIKEHFKRPIGRITGLDPDRWEFTNLTAEHKLDRSDAAFVDIIHTDCAGNTWPSLSSEWICGSMGTVDFYPQGGFRQQPACGTRNTGTNEDDTWHCSHRISRDYFVESLDSIAFLATQCEYYDTFMNKECDHNETTIMGEHIDKSQRGRFYLYVDKKSPYGLYGDRE